MDLNEYMDDLSGLDYESHRDGIELSLSGPHADMGITNDEIYCRARGGYEPRKDQADSQRNRP